MNTHVVDSRLSSFQCWSWRLGNNNNFLQAFGIQLRLLLLLGMVRCLGSA